MSEKTEKKDKPEKPDVKVALATFNERFMAGLIDYGIIIGSFIIGTIILSILSWVSWGLIEILFWFLGSILELVALAAFVFLKIYMPYKKDGQSFGKKKQNIKIMIIEDEEKWTLRDVQEDDIGPIIVRAILGWFEVAIIPVVIAWYFITNDNNRQRLADQVGKTVIVQVDPETLAPLNKPRTAETKQEEKPAK
ncbi:MAG: RDD family protein [Candidatus Heimdallarchaeota archaeon]